MLKGAPNTAQLPTKSYQVEEVGRLEGKPKSSFQLGQNQGENKIKKVKTSLLAYLQKSYNALVTYLSSTLSNLHNN